MRLLFWRDQLVDEDPGRVVLLATDRPVQRRRRWPYMVSGTAVLLVAGLVALYVLSSRAASTLAVSPEGLTIATATTGPFTEFIPLRGRILPRETVYLDLVQEGRVEEIFQRAGDYVEVGAPLVRTSNPTLELSISTQESNAINHLDQQMSLRLNLSQALGNAEAELKEATYRVEQLQRTYTMQKQLSERGVSPAAKEKSLGEDLAYWTALSEIRSRALERTKLQAEEIERSISETSRRLDETIHTARSQLDALTLRAPITGYLTHLDVSLGQHLTAGQSVGQIDNNEGFKVEAQLDEFYLDRVRIGQRILGSIGGADVVLTVTRISPRITEGKFKVEADFASSVSLPGVTRGQAITGRLELAQQNDSILTIPLGAFWETTGGNWVFVVDGSTATRRTIKAGRRTVDAVEVLEGLTEGERIITSSYQGFDNYRNLTLN
ncbi:HlyD family efflux transporter periplasmic adaptor subunit [Haematospirillum jordaniae]|uniref:efflux RND transporter periplasmic adaptor subunit n=1 Tax=Haematospirillum jordaniae TaxID=1549855 RepID=UPI001432C41E|nr:HlyD family efflux transporter periplasmic adaptor subunit [Haematospirillum jordaniae]NKD86257.1 HlyD family efflux transporter periplasmic adaptor subunit [Haematospirillum jordaniae]